ncbi:Lar family restriction alleviation protein [Stenotrophomonas rhizophila]|uniref:Lar family restriction alleviation protein n=1 Tax=Stenotrophomonas rhizophila TaxID=216778 RepID=UPI003392C6D8
MSAELKPCPFCGGDAGIRNWQDEELWSHAIVEWQKVHCTECECEGISSCPGYEPDTVQAWNTRAALTPPEGYVLVPVEPTRQMQVAALEGEWNRATPAEVWAAMLAARPEVPGG